jgi:hypothetical protein
MLILVVIQFKVTEMEDKKADDRVSRLASGH